MPQDSKIVAGMLLMCTLGGITRDLFVPSLNDLISLTNLFNFDYPEALAVGRYHFLYTFSCGYHGHGRRRRELPFAPRLGLRPGLPYVVVRVAAP